MGLSWLPLLPVLGAFAHSAKVQLPAVGAELPKVISHIGRTPDAGHYVYYNRTQTGVWICYDDDKCFEVETSEVLSSQAYLGLYVSSMQDDFGERAEKLEKSPERDRSRSRGRAEDRPNQDSIMRDLSQMMKDSEDAQRADDEPKKECEVNKKPEDPLGTPKDPIDENVVHPKQKPDHGGLVETRPELEAALRAAQLPLTGNRMQMMARLAAHHKSLAEKAYVNLPSMCANHVTMVEDHVWMAERLTACERTSQAESKAMLMKRAKEEDVKKACRAIQPILSEEVIQEIWHTFLAWQEVSQENIDVLFLALGKNGKRKLQDISKDVLVSLEGKTWAEVVQQAEAMRKNRMHMLCIEKLAARMPDLVYPDAMSMIIEKAAWKHYFLPDALAEVAEEGGKLVRDQLSTIDMPPGLRFVVVEVLKMRRASLWMEFEHIMAGFENGLNQEDLRLFLRILDKALATSSDHQKRRISAEEAVSILSQLLGWSQYRHSKAGTRRPKGKRCKSCENMVESLVTTGWFGRDIGSASLVWRSCHLGTKAQRYLPVWRGHTALQRLRAHMSAQQSVIGLRQLHRIRTSAAPKDLIPLESCADATEEDEVVEVQDQKHVRRPATTLLPARPGHLRPEIMIDEELRNQRRSRDEISERMWKATSSSNAMLSWD